MKKLMLFASLALATGFLGIPSTVSAHWTSNGNPIPPGTNPQIHGIGSFSFAGPTGGISCTEVTVTLQLTGGTTTEHMQQLSPTLSSCKATGALAGCTINSITTTGFPWTGHAFGRTITQTGVQIQNHLSGFLCPSTLQLDTTWQHHVVLQPFLTGMTGDFLRMGGFHFGGSLLVTEVNSTFQAGGSVTFTSSDSHKYGFTVF